MLFHLFPEGVCYTSQTYGARPSYYRKYGHKGHNGYDFAPINKSERPVIYAPHDGYVTIHWGNSGYGNCLEILSDPRGVEGERLLSDIAHIHSFLVDTGQFVHQGDPIAVMGGDKGAKGSGDSTGRHAHWAPKKTDRDGNVLNKNNGYGGALPIAPFVRRWIPRTLAD